MNNIPIDEIIAASLSNLTLNKINPSTPRRRGIFLVNELEIIEINTTSYGARFSALFFMITGCFSRGFGDTPFCLPGDIPRGLAGRAGVPVSPMILSMFLCTIVGDGSTGSPFSLKFGSHRSHGMGRFTARGAAMYS